YLVLKDYFIQQLRGIFEHVAIPPHVSDKLDHGDFDTIVCGPKGNLASLPDLKSLQAILQSSYLTTITHSTEANTHATRRPSHSQKRFVQVDVQLYDAPSQFEWKVFSYAYGDLYNILKIGVQPFGFTLRPSGLFLRIAEIDAINKDASPVFLTNDVQLVLEFFGLDFQRYNQGFDNLEELFGYATSSHLFSRLQFSLQNASLKPGTSPSKRSKRASWVQFTEQWLPSHPEIGTTFDENDKSTIHANALQIFDREPLYWKKLNAFR
ncbi:hypothetical protein EJ08DRAFT_572074, partial [Tothia fuscella]